MNLKQQIKFIELIIFLLGLICYYFLIRIPLNQLVLLHEKHKIRKSINITSNADKALIKKLDFDENMFISDMVTATKHCHLSLKQFTPSTSEHRNHYKIETISLNILGAYFDCITFMNLLLKLPYIISFSHIELTNLSQQQISLQLTMEVYHY